MHEYDSSHPSKTQMVGQKEEETHKKGKMADLKKTSIYQFGPKTNNQSFKLILTSLANVKFWQNIKKWGGGELYKTNDCASRY